MAVLTKPNESYSITMRVEIENKPGMLGKVTTAIGNAGGDIGAVDLSGHGKGSVTRTSRRAPAASTTRRRSSTPSRPPRA